MDEAGPAREAPGSATPPDPAASTATPPAEPERRGFHLGYQPGLDGFRGLAVIFIMMFHSFILWPALYGNLAPGAYITVNMFFVLSGFLITSLLLEERERSGGTSYKSFYQRRALRLLPALLVLLIVHVMYTIIVGNALGPELAAVGWISGYASNWAQWAGKMQQVGTGLTWGHTWTLSVEEQFYLIWPFVLVAAIALARQLRTLAWLLGVGIVFVTVERFIVAASVTVPAGPHHDMQLAHTLERLVGIRTDLRADTLMLGALAAVLLHMGWRPSRWVRPVASVTLVALIAVSLLVQPDSRAMYMWGFTLIDAGGALLCIAVLDRGWRPSSVFWTKPAAWLGRLSYALYLWHPPVFVAVIQQEPNWPVALKIIVGWVLTFAFAIASYYLIETPFLRLKGRLSRRAHGPSDAPTEAITPAAAT